MSPLYYRRGRNWYTAMGMLFVIIGSITLGRELILWESIVFFDFLINSDITSVKIAIVTIVGGIIIVVYGFRKKFEPPR